MIYNKSSSVNKLGDETIEDYKHSVAVNTGASVSVYRTDIITCKWTA